MILGNNNGSENFSNGKKVLALMASPRKTGYTAKLLGTLLREFPKGTDIEIVSLYEVIRTALMREPTSFRSCSSYMTSSPPLRRI